MAEVEITIFGSDKVDRDTCEIKEGDTVVFVLGEDADDEVHHICFTEETPFGTEHYKVPKKSNGGRKKTGAANKTGEPEGDGFYHYRYTVVPDSEYSAVADIERKAWLKSRVAKVLAAKVADPDIIIRG